MIKIPVKGVIVDNSDKAIYEWFGMEATAPKDIDVHLQNANGEEVEVQINSVGGLVDAGSDIYTILKDYPGNVICKITGLAASAASVIAMAGDTVKISPTAQIMIHNVSSCACGDYRDLMHEASVIENYNKSIANAYILKTNIEEQKLLDLMDKETWLNAQQAKELGFADEIMFDTNNKLVASYGVNNLIPQAVIDKVRNNFSQLDMGKETNKNNDREKGKLALIKLKGATIHEEE